MTMLKKIVSVIIAIVLGISIALCCTVMVKSVLGMDKSLFGMRFFYLVSGSMEPTIPAGAAVVVKKGSSYEIGDVITFESSDAAINGFPNTHRIVERTEVNGRMVYTTRGDANPVADEAPVTETAIYGKVIMHTGKAMWLGTLIGMLTTPLGFITVIILPVLVIVAILMRDFTREYKAALAAEAAAMASAAQPVPPTQPAPQEASAQPEPVPQEAPAQPEPESGNKE